MTDAADGVGEYSTYEDVFGEDDGVRPVERAGETNAPE